MPDREIRFTAESVERGDRMMMAQVAHCSEPGCRKKQPIFNQKGSRVIPPALFKRKLQQHGWTIRHAVDPYCPEHSHVETKKLKAKPVPPLVEAVHLLRAGFNKAPRQEPLTPVEAEHVRNTGLTRDLPPVLQEQVMATTPTPIRSLDQLGDATARVMTVDHRRRINRAINDNWDDAKDRYLGDMTDQKIAAELSLPRAWVEQVRVENFGDSGGNEEIERLKEEFTAKLSEWDEVVTTAQRAVDKAVDAVGKMEGLRADLKGLRQRLERVEVATLPRRA